MNYIQMVDTVLYIYFNYDLCIRCIERANSFYESEFSRVYIEMFDREIDYIW